jgi:hypothetical protein
MFLRETIESLVKGAYPRGHALSASTDGSLYFSVGHVCLLFPVSFHSRDQMIIEELLPSVFALKPIVIHFDTTKAHNRRWR